MQPTQAVIISRCHEWVLAIQNFFANPPIGTHEQAQAAVTAIYGVFGALKGLLIAVLHPIIQMMGG